MTRCVETISAVRSSRFDLPLTYDAGDLDLRVGDVVRMPIGSREHVGFVIAEPQEREEARALRLVRPAGVPRAFDETGLALAHFVADHYLCTLGEALGAVVLSGAVPRTLDTIVPVGEAPEQNRLSALIWGDFREGFVLERLLRHPEARRAGDRSTLLRAVNAMLRAGRLRRERRVVDPKVREYRVRVLHPGTAQPRGAKAAALLRLVQEQPGMPRADALLAGFSSAVIARAVRSGFIEEREVLRGRTRSREHPAAPVFSPTDEQARAIQALCEQLERPAFCESLLFGITGSGKTFVYIRLIERALQLGMRAIVLVPEISLTPQTARRFEQAFGDRVAVLHSALSERERFDAWQACANGAVEIVVGARSAVFAPLPNVRLIVVDESHESSYRQETVPRYHAVSVARERMRLANGLLLLGSATPSLESYRDAKAGTTTMLRLSRRATDQPLPSVRVVDMSREFEEGNRRIFSGALLHALSERMERGEQSVLFVNRRGSAGFLLCRACGNVPTCARCSVSLRVHRAEGLLRCHYCDAQQPAPSRCSVCSNEAIREFGVGTQRVAQEVQGLFPRARVIRMDADTTTRIGDHARLLDEFGERGDILVGTQMVAKGLDFPRVTLVGVVAADVGLHAPDFRAAERSFALIAQVCGRSGRAAPGEAIVQTYSATHPAIVYAAQHDYEGFAQAELLDRAALGYPPEREMLLLGVFGGDREQTRATASEYAESLKEAGAGEVFGPAPMPVARVKDEWRFMLALKCEDAARAREAVSTRVLPAARRARRTRLAVHVDA